MAKIESMAFKVLPWIAGPENLFCNFVSARPADAYNSYSGLTGGGGNGRDSITVSLTLSVVRYLLHQVERSGPRHCVVFSKKP